MVRALEELPGVKKASASHPGKMTVVQYDPASISIEEMCQALLKIGYVASPKATNRTAPAVGVDESTDNSDYRAEDFICYCFKYKKADIENDFVKNGRSFIMEKIAKEKKAGGCDCASKNPEGR